MSFHLTIEASDATEMRTKIASLARSWGVVGAGQVDITGPLPHNVDNAGGHDNKYYVNQSPAPTSETKASQTVETTEKKKKKSPVQSVDSEDARQMALPLSATTAATETESKVAAQSTPPITKEDVRAELTKVNATIGTPRVREILQSFGYKSVSEIEESKFKEVLAACQESLKNAAAG